MMGGVTPVGTWGLPDITSQTPTVRFSQQDSNAAVAQRVVDCFAPHPTSPASMNVAIDAGFTVYTDPKGQQTVTELAPSTVSIAAAPGSPNSRIDLIQVDSLFGDVTILTGTPSTSPVAPTPAQGTAAICQVLVASGVTAITAADIVDVRSVWNAGLREVPWISGGGTGDAVTAGYTPRFTSLPDGMLLAVRAPGANATTSPTFSPNGLTAEPITKKGGSALTAGDIAGAGHELFLAYNSSAARWELLNPATAGYTLTSGAIVSALGYTPQNAATGPSGAAIIAALGYTPASAASIGSVLGSLTVATSTTLVTSNLNQIVVCGGGSPYDITMPAPVNNAVIEFVNAAGPTINILAATAGDLVSLTSSGSGSSIPLSGVSNGGWLRFVGAGGKWWMTGQTIGS